MPGNVGGLIEVHPHAAHGVVHAGKNLHGRVARVVAYELLVNFQNAFEFAIKNLAIDVGQVEIDHRLAVDAEVVLVHNFVNGAGRDVARHQVAVLWIPLFQEVPALVFRDCLRVALVARSFRDPDASTFSAGRLGHQAQLVFAGNASGMDLNELAVRVIAALLIQRRLRRSRAHHGVRRPAEDRAVAAGGKNDGVRWESANLHGPQIHGADAATHPVRIEHRR